MNKASKLKVGQAEEYLNAVGQEDEEKASKWVIETQSQVEKTEKKINEDKRQQLLDARKKKMQYQEAAAKLLYERANTIDWPKGYKWRVGYRDDDKINLTFIDRTGKGYGRGIKLTGTDYLDLNAIHIIATQAENTVDQIEHPPKTESGVYLK